MQAADMHTHACSGTGLKLVSCNNNSLSEYTSKEFHPWYLPEKFTPLSEQFIEELTQFNALGEIGLDRLRGPELSVQRRYFEALIDIAQSLKKPIVIHNVRCETEIISALKGFSFPVLFHGFNGGVKAFERILEAGYFVSLRTISNDSVVSFLKSRGLERIGIESDDTCQNIDETADYISHILDMDMKTNSVETFRKFLSL